MIRDTPGQGTGIRDRRQASPAGIMIREGGRAIQGERKNI